MLQRSGPRTRQIALFGGTFDPPHLGHEQIAVAAVEAFGLDAVWWIPTYDPPHKQQEQVASYTHRLAMTKLAVQSHATFFVKNLEEGRQGPSYTVDTVASVCRDHPDDNFWLLIGEDSLRQFHSWKSPERIAALTPLIVYPRQATGSGPIQAVPGTCVHLLSMPVLSYSSSGIRTRVAKGRSIAHLVPQATEAYIAAHGLYR